MRWCLYLLIFFFSGNQVAVSQEKVEKKKTYQLSVTISGAKEQWDKGGVVILSKKANHISYVTYKTCVLKEGENSCTFQDLEEGYDYRVSVALMGHDVLHQEVERLSKNQTLTVRVPDLSETTLSVDVKTSPDNKMPKDAVLELYRHGNLVRQILTTGKGAYLFKNLEPGYYVVKVSLPGYAEQSHIFEHLFGSMQCSFILFPIKKKN